MLLQRNAKTLQIWAHYIYFLQKALSKLPDEECTVYRGVNAIDIVQKEYLKGRRIHWSGFSSTTRNFEIAKEFAGKDGVVMQISVENGKSIKEYSFLPREDEILLSPNMAFIVTEDIFSKNDTLVIKLSQKKLPTNFCFLRIPRINRLVSPS